MKMKIGVWQKKQMLPNFLPDSIYASDVSSRGIYYSEPNLSLNYIDHVIPKLLKPQELL